MREFPCKWGFSCSYARLDFRPPDIKPYLLRINELETENRKLQSETHRLRRRQVTTEERLRSLTPQEAEQLLDNLVTLLSNESLAPQMSEEVVEELHDAGYTDKQIDELGKRFGLLAQELLTEWKLAMAPEHAALEAGEGVK